LASLIAQCNQALEAAGWQPKDNRDYFTKWHGRMVRVLIIAAWAEDRHYGELIIRRAECESSARPDQMRHMAAFADTEAIHLGECEGSADALAKLLTGLDYWSERNPFHDSAEKRNADMALFREESATRKK
jgi:hypothetical protein